MATQVSQSNFVAICNPEGAATSTSQNTTTTYYIDGVQVGQTCTTTSLTLTQFQSIVAVMQPE